MKSEDEKSLVKSEDEKSLVKSEDEKSLDESPSAPKVLGLIIEKAFFLGVSWMLITKPYDYEIEVVGAGKGIKAGLKALMDWLPIWVKGSFALLIIGFMFIIVFAGITEAKAKNKLTVWWLIFFAPEGLLCFTGVYLSFKYVLIYWYRY